MSGTLEARLQRLEDIEAIRHLKAEYCAACDDDHNPDRVAALFVEDGVWHRQDEEPNQGHAAIKAYMQAIRDSGMIRNSLHMVSNPQITVTGDTAVAKWRFVMMFTGNAPDGSTQYHRIIGDYVDDHVKVDGDWYFKVLRPFVVENNAYSTEHSKFAAE